MIHRQISTGAQPYRHWRQTNTLCVRFEALWLGEENSHVSWDTWGLFQSQPVEQFCTNQQLLRHEILLIKHREWWRKGEVLLQHKWWDCPFQNPYCWWNKNNQMQMLKLHNCITCSAVQWSEIFVASKHDATHVWKAIAFYIYFPLWLSVISGFFLSKCFFFFLVESFGLYLQLAHRGWS